jgi:hypothetical protein
MANLDPTQRTLLAETNFKVAELLCKELGIKLSDLMTIYKSEAGFILAAIQSIIISADLKNEADLNALENQSPEC